MNATKEPKMKNLAEAIVHDATTRFSNLDLDFSDDAAPKLPTETKELVGQGFIDFFEAARAHAKNLSDEVGATIAGELNTFISSLCQWIEAQPTADAAVEAVSSAISAAVAQETSLPVPAEAPAVNALPAEVAATTRLTRLYAVLNKRGIAMGSMSTDQCVKNALPRLQALLEETERLHADHLAKGHKLSQGALDFVVDLKCLMRRTPDARIDESQVKNSIEAKVQTKVQRAKAEVIAVGTADETTGAIAYWELSGTTSMTILREKWLEQGLDEKLLKPAASNRVALNRAVKERQDRNVFAEIHPLGGWALVRKTTDNKILDFKVGTRVFLKPNADGKITESDEIVAEPGEGQTQAQADALAAQVKVDFARFLDVLTTEDVSTWLVGIISRFKAVPMRESGAMYFLPAPAVEEFRKVQAAVQASGSHFVNEIPAIRSPGIIRGAIKGLDEEVVKMLTATENELLAEDGLGVRAAGTRMDTLDAAKAKVESYGKLLGKDFKGLLDRIAALRAKLAKVASRTNQIEVD